MPEICPECGGAPLDGKTCQEIFDAFLVLEFTDPGYGEVHFLTVACFMIQHGRYSDEGLAWIHGMMTRYFEEGLTHEQLRRLAAQNTGTRRRTWKVKRRPDAPEQARIDWSMRIGDVDARYLDAASYRELIRQWARVTLDEMAPLITRSTGRD